MNNKVQVISRKSHVPEERGPTPAEKIAKGIIGGVQPVVLADGIGHAFGLHFTGAAVGAVGLLYGRGFRVDGVELGMGDLMDSRL